MNKNSNTVFQIKEVIKTAEDIVKYHVKLLADSISNKEDAEKAKNSQLGPTDENQVSRFLYLSEINRISAKKYKRYADIAVDNVVCLVKDLIVKNDYNLSNKTANEFARFFDKVTGYTEYRLPDNLYYTKPIEMSDIVELKERLKYVSVNPTRMVGDVFSVDFSRHDHRGFNYLARAAQWRDSRIAANYVKGKNPYFMSKHKLTLYKNHKVTDKDFAQYEFTKLIAKRRAAQIAAIENRIIGSLAGQFSVHSYYDDELTDIKEKAKSLTNKKNLRPYEEVFNELFTDFRKKQIVDYLKNDLELEKHESNYLAKLVIEHPEVVHEYSYKHCRPIARTLIARNEGLRSLRMFDEF